MILEIQWRLHRSTDGEGPLRPIDGIGIVGNPRRYRETLVPLVRSGLGSREPSSSAMPIQQLGGAFLVPVENRPGDKQHRILNDRPAARKIPSVREPKPRGEMP